MGTSEQLIKYACHLGFTDLSGLVVNCAALRIEDQHVRDVAGVVLLDELLLLSRACLVQINDHELHSSLVLLVQTDGAASLPLGIKSTLAKHKDVIRPSVYRAVFDVVTSDEGAILAVAGIIKPRVEPQVLGGPQIRSHTQSGSH